jgi:hypothetical protein
MNLVLLGQCALWVFGQDLSIGGSGKLLQAPANATTVIKMASTTTTLRMGHLLMLQRASNVDASA